MRLIGLDPGLRLTGWGVIEADGNRLRHIANGRVQSKGEDLGERLRQRGQEFGATTGRPRRTGWFDAAAMKRSGYFAATCMTWRPPMQ